MTHKVPLYFRTTVADGLCSSTTFSLLVAAAAAAVARMEPERGSSRLTIQELFHNL